MSGLDNGQVSREDVESFDPNRNTEPAQADFDLDTAPWHDVRELMPSVYSELRRMAHLALVGERTGHTLQATALVHEAFLKLFDQRQARWRSADHFCAVAAQTMRRVLVDHARGRNRLKRGGNDRVRVPLTGIVSSAPLEHVDLIALDEALQRLASIDPTAARVVEWRFFAGLPIEPIAELMGISERTVRRHWIYAKAWLARELLVEPTSPDSTDDRTTRSDMP